jgi:hypothetical protein
MSVCQMVFGQVIFYQTVSNHLLIRSLNDEEKSFKYLTIGDAPVSRRCTHQQGRQSLHGRMWRWKSYKTIYSTVNKLECSSVAIVFGLA